MFNRKRKSCDLRWHKSSQVLHFRYIVWHFLDHTFLMIVGVHSKTCLKDTFLLPLLSCVVPSLTISFFFFHLAGVLLWYKITSTSSKDAMFNFDTKDFHRLVFCVQTTRKSSQAERNLRWNFEQAQNIRKLPQAIASWQSNHSTPNSRLTMWVYYFVILSFILL